MKKHVWMLLALLAAGCGEDEQGKKTAPGDERLSTLQQDTRLEGIARATLAFVPQSGTYDTYALTLATDADVSATGGTGAFVQFLLRVEQDASPFGRYAIGTTGGEGEQALPGRKEGQSWYYEMADGQVVNRAPLTAGQLTLSKVPGKKPSDTYYYASFAATDDAATPHSVAGEYSGPLTYAPKPGEAKPATTYVLAGVSGYTAEAEYTTWGIDFDNADFTRHLAIFSLNAGPGIAEEEGIPSGTYTIAEDDAPFTATWVSYDDSAQGISMQDLIDGTVTIQRDGEHYKVAIDATDWEDAPFTADFEGTFHYENTSEERTFEAREVYAVYYGPVAGGTSWYITLADRGYLETGDAVGNYYYGSILRLDLVAEGDAAFADGLPEGTFPVLDSRSGAGIYGGTGSDCTSFLTEYFSGSPAVCKLTGGSVRIARDGEQVTITLDRVAMAGDITSLDGTYTGKVQYIRVPEQ